MLGRSIGLFALVSALPATAMAVNTSYVETFGTDVAGWRDTSGANTLSFVSTGGPDGSSYVSTAFSFATSGTGSTPVMFRAETSTNASNGSFFGDWTGANVASISFDVRQNTSEALTFFARLATAANFPGAAIVASTVVQPNTWTTITLSIDPTNPNLTLEGPPSIYSSVFGAVGRLQIGVITPGDLVNSTQPAFTFDIDNVRFTTVPAPAAAGLLGLAGMFGARRRR